MPLKAIWASNTPYSKFLLAVGIMLISAVLFTLIGTLSVSMIYDVSFSELQETFNSDSNPQAISMLKFMQTISAIGAFVIPALVIAYLFSSQPLSYLSLDKKASSMSIVLVVLALTVALPLINFLVELNSQMSFPSFLSGIEKWMRDSEDKAAEITERFLVMNTTSDLLVNLVMIGLLPAIGEELLFRGVIQRLFTDWSKSIHLGIWLSAILFSAMHLQFYGFIPRMLLGALFGYLLAWSGSLWLPVIAHFINNASAVLFTYLFREEIMSVDPDKVGTEGEMTSVLISIFVMAALLFLVYRNEKNRMREVLL